MLVLSRRPGDGVRSAVTITTPAGDVIRVVVIDVDRNKVRIGIDCPKRYLIMRDELLTTPPGDGKPPWEE